MVQPGAHRLIMAASCAWLMIPGTSAPGRPSAFAASWSVNRGKSMSATFTNRRTMAIDTSGCSSGRSSPSSMASKVGMRSGVLCVSS